MSKRKFLIFMSLLLAIAVVAWSFGVAVAQNSDKLLDKILKEKGKVTWSERKAAGANAKTKGLQVGITAAPIINPITGSMVPDYFGVANWAYSPPLQKFMDALPTLTFATPDPAAYLGSDYYEIELGEYSVKMHSSLPATKLRGYRQINMGGTPFSYLGPVIVAQKDRPVRIKFVNNLPTGVGGNLFVPVDTTVMGAGMGPDGMNMYTQNRATVHLHGNNTIWISDGTPHQWITPANETTPYPEGVSVRPVPDMNGAPANDTGIPTDGIMTLYYTNAQSARLMFYHDHAYGITRLNVYAGEAAGYLITDAVESDLINGTNVTGVNPGLLKVLPDVGIPLVIQDKTFVDPATIGATDPTWLDPTQPTFGTNPGTAVLGDLWYPHVYMPNQNPWDITGGNGFGRWDYGPWFYPAVPAAALIQGPQPNPYYDPINAPWEPPQMPGVPSLSAPGEAFMDTPIVNGMAYPYLNVEPRAYRFRILNAADDRFLNLQMYVANTGIIGSIALTSGGSGYTADPAVTITPSAGDVTGHGATATATADLNPFLPDGVTPNPTFGQVIAVTINSVGSNYTAAPIVTIAPPTAGIQATATAALYGNLPGQLTEVGMVPTPEITLPNHDVSGVPDPAMAGPNWWHIGTEGGFSPAPVVVPNQHITWNLNPKTFNFGNVVNHSLLLGSAERADVIVDFSAYAGKTIILYNDAPAAFPAIDPRLDYYTNDLDQTAIGGAPTTPPGFGPNTRTIMQFIVGTTVATPTPDVTLANLQTVWAKNSATGKRGVFEASQDPIIVPQATYNSAYNATFPSTVPAQYVQISETSKTFQPIDATGALQPAVAIPIEEKAAHDEMGGVYDPYGRMNAMLGLSLPATTSQIAQFLPYGYASPPVDLISGSVSGTLVGSLGDGTQIWRITQNGVDTHTIHVHLTNAQLLNRVGWDGMMIPPDPIELGWKETFRVNPLEQTFIAMRPILPTVAQVPFLDQIPNSVRLIDPTMPPGAVLEAPPPAGWFDPFGNAITQILNHEVNFGWEYVYHCHILAHEEMDMMHSFNLAVAPAAPSNLTGVRKGSSFVLNWMDNSANETSFTIQRAQDLNFGLGLVTWNVGANITTFTDTTFKPNQLPYYYRVFAINTVGDTATPGFPTMTANSAFAVVGAPLGATTLNPLTQAAPTKSPVVLTWSYSGTDQTGFTIQRATNAGFTAGLTTFKVGNVLTYSDTSIKVGVTYYYRVAATNALGTGSWSNTQSILTH